VISVYFLIDTDAYQSEIICIADGKASVDTFIGIINNVPLTELTKVV